MKRLSLAVILVLAVPSLFASADLVTTSDPGSTLIRAGYNSSVYFLVRNNGPDPATAVTLSVSTSIPITCGCNLGNIPPGQSRLGVAQFVSPSGGGTVTFTATASSATPDTNPDNNTAVVSLNVSTDPDVTLALSTPDTQDLSLPFTLNVFLSNFSITTAHEIEVNIDFRYDVTVQSLPNGCSSPTAGRILCRLDSLPPTASGSAPAFSIKLIAPVIYGSGSVIFTGIAIEREHDFDPISNTATRQMTLYKTFYVSNTNDATVGSLRQAILDANAQCRGDAPCAIVFRIDQASATPWKTINVLSPLPTLTGSRVRMDGATQAAFFGDKNADGPEIEISGRGIIDGDGLVIANCGAEVANLAVNDFLRNGISMVQPPSTSTCSFFGSNLHHLFVGTDPTGSIARPNSRGIGTSFMNGTNINQTGPAVSIQDSVISGNQYSGIFGMSGRLNIQRNRIGVKAHSDDPLPNGNAGVFIGAGGYGSDVGAPYFAVNSPPPVGEGNVIAFNGQMGVAVAPGIADVAIRNNRIWGNKLLGIDIGLNGPTQEGPGVVPMPSLSLAFYDPVTKKTVIDGDLRATDPPSNFSTDVDFFANDAPDPTGLGEGQRPIGILRVPGTPPAHFRFTVDGDFTGKFISATMTRVRYIGFAKPVADGISDAFLTQTSEFSPVIEVR
jgi:hypothetical protein